MFVFKMLYEERYILFVTGCLLEKKKKKQV